MYKFSGPTYPVGAVPNQDVLNLDDLEALEP